MQSAGILVVRPLPPNSQNTVERIVDIRVDDHEEPFKELRRLLMMTTGVPNRLLARSAELSKEGKHDEAVAEAKKALEINPRSEQAMYQLARRYAAAGDTTRALEYLSRAVARQPKQWAFEAASDPAFEQLRSLPVFQRLIKP
jgi:tetratricopeptide (TPR) repeat protein